MKTVMRKIFLAVLSLITAGLCVTAGTATAAAPARGDGHDINCTTATSCTGPGGTPYTGSTSACTTFPCTLESNGTLDTDPTHVPGTPGWHPGFHPGWPGPIPVDPIPVPNGGLGLSLLNGDIIQLDDGLQVNVCQVPAWNDFYTRFGLSHNAWVRAHQLNELRYQQLLARANCNTTQQVVVGNGLTLVNGNVIDLNAYGVIGGAAVNVCTYNTWNDLAAYGNRFYGPRWNTFGSRYGGYLAGNWSQLRLRARCTPNVVFVPSSSSSTVVEQPAPTYAPAATPAPATQAPTVVSPEDNSPAPTQVSRQPSVGAISTGDGSAPEVR